MASRSMGVEGLTALLVAAAGGDAAARSKADTQLERLKQHSYVEYVDNLTSALANEENPYDARQHAGVLIKNSLDATEQRGRAEKRSRWCAMDRQVRDTIKSSLLANLQASEQCPVRHVSAAIIAKVAAAEMPNGMWPDLVTSLAASMASHPHSAAVRQASLEAVAFIGEELVRMPGNPLSPDDVHTLVDLVMGSMQPEEDAGVRLAATRALRHIIEYADLSEAQLCASMVHLVCQVSSGSRRTWCMQMHTDHVMLLQAWGCFRSAG